MFLLINLCLRNQFSAFYAIAPTLYAMEMSENQNFS